MANKHLRSAATLFPQLLLTLAAILVGWGLDDFADFASEPARLALLAVIVVAYFAGVALGIDPNPFRKGDGKTAAGQ